MNNQYTGAGPNNQQQANTQQNTPRKPEYRAYNVTNTQDGKSHWNPVGAAWMHSDQQGMEIQLDSTPVDGRVTLREIRDQEMQRYDQQHQENTQAQGQNLNHAQTQAQDNGQSR